ncbi:Phosphatidylinositol N-acetyglucosaminlytransferase subunit P-related [Quillaja saponaria]|nr:Phosphatidylinositol N-acetyglucosaminlytransferase subunit P-related [Quillaja saponaria]
MNGVQNRRAHNFEKPYPRCLGRMVNLFDLTTDVTGNSMLTDKPHRDVPSLLKSPSDVARMTSTLVGDQIEDKLIALDLRRTSSNKKVNGTSMKLLIDREMSKDVNSTHNPPNVVAKLMGLDTLPWQPDSAVQRSHTKDYSQLTQSDSGVRLGCWQQVDGFTGKGMPGEVGRCREQNNYKDIQFQRTSLLRDKVAQRGRCSEDIDKELAFFCQKFADLKRMGTDDKQRQSKKFRDTLEYVSSRDDLLFRYLQENDSFFSQRLFEVQSTSPAETKRITVLRPSKMVCNDKFAGPGKRNENEIRKLANVSEVAVLDKNNTRQSPVTEKIDEYPVQPTRIVVLKPSPGKAHDIKDAVSPTSSSPRILQSENFYEEVEDDEVLESRKVATEIADQMHDSFLGHQRDETLFSSVFSNGYIGDESSFNRSDNEYAVGNFSDVEVMSPAARHSWDYINRCGSPFSSSSFSRASCSPESSVCREAKKRLSERWAMMASSGSSLQQRHVRRSSSTLGEMLALSDIKKSARSEDDGGNNDREKKESVSRSTRNLNEEPDVGGSPKNLQRSKSVPVSSAVFENGLNVEVCNPEAGKAHASKEMTKTKSIKSSLKGKVTSLFFSRDRKSRKDKSRSTVETLESPGESGSLGDKASQSFNDGACKEYCVPATPGFSGKCSSDLVSKGLKQGLCSHEPGLSVSKPMMSGVGSENQDQPSPISVLEPPFEEDDNAAQESSANTKAGHLGTHAVKSKLIDKSPPIESIARTLSWDDTCAEVTPYPLKSSMVSPDTEVEEQDWLVFVQTLLSVAGLDDQVKSESFLSRWHSLESPLDPSLRDKYANLNVKEPVQQAKQRQWRSNRKLVFDCVNESLMEITGCGSEKCSSAKTCSGGHSRLSDGASTRPVDRVMAQMKELLSSEMRCLGGDYIYGDSSSLVVEKVVRKEVVGKGWSELLRLEIDNFAKEIEVNLLEEFLVDAVVDLKDRV